MSYLGTLGVCKHSNMPLQLPVASSTPLRPSKCRHRSLRELQCSEAQRRTAPPPATSAPAELAARACGVADDALARVQVCGIVGEQYALHRLVDRPPGGCGGGAAQRHWFLAFRVCTVMLPIDALQQDDLRAATTAALNAVPSLNAPPFRAAPYLSRALKEGTRRPDAALCVAAHAVGAAEREGLIRRQVAPQAAGAPAQAERERPERQRLLGAQAQAVEVEPVAVRWECLLERRCQLAAVLGGAVMDRGRNGGGRVPSAPCSRLSNTISRVSIGSSSCVHLRMHADQQAMR